jgi:PAS domain S-box-containing protein
MMSVLDTMPEREFDDLTALAAAICQAPLALITVFDEKGSSSKAKHGIASGEVSRVPVFCAHAIEAPSTFIVEDSSLDDRFKDHVQSGEPVARFYAGAQLRDSNGRAFGILSVLDHRPRKLSSEQIHALEALSRNVVSLMEKSLNIREVERQTTFVNRLMSAQPNLVAYLDREFRYRYANTAYETWFGLDAAAIIGKTIGDVLGQETFAASRKHMEKAMAGRQVEFQRELPYNINGKRQPRTVRVNYIPDVEIDGTVNGIFGVVTDLSDKTIALEKLDAKEREVQRIFDALPVLVAHWDRDQRNLSANRAYSEYFHLAAEQIIGMHLRDVLGPEIYAKNLPFIEGVLSGKPQTFERALPHKDGTTRFTLANYLPDIEDGSVNGFFVIVTDITTVKTLENERKALEARMIASAKLAELGEMAGGIAHEINSPLAAIMGRVGLMKDRVSHHKFDAEIFSRDLAKIEVTVERIAKIITGLKAFSRGGENDPMVEVSVSVVVQNTLELCQERFKHMGVELRLNVPQDLMVSCRESQVSQILLNLMNNGLDAIKELPDKWISLDFEKTDEMLRCFVTDSGPGIPEATVEKIMQPFFTTKEVGKGTGLGLSVSLGLARAHEGDLFYVKDCGHTRFCLELPLHSRGGQSG